jgi:hypothetical protein
MPESIFMKLGMYIVAPELTSRAYFINPPHSHHHHHHHHHHQQWQNSPVLNIAFLRRFSQIASGFHLFGFRNNSSFIEQGRQTCVQTPTWRARSLYLSPTRTGCPGYTPGTGFSFRCPLRLAGLRWRYSNLPPHVVSRQSVCLYV